MQLKTINFLTFLILALMGTATISFAANRIDITPRGIIIEPRERSGEMTLLNLSDTEGTFRVSIINYRQKEDGAYEILTGPLNPIFDPEQVIRLSPRQFTLPAQGKQKVRFSIRKPADLPDGEYRFHLVAMRMADYGPPSPLSGGQIVGVTTNISTAIPVVIRHGQVQASATLSDLQYSATPGPEGFPLAKFTVNREGNISTMGSAKAYWTSAGGETVEVGKVTNLNVFTDIQKRQVTMALTKPFSGSGTLRIVYTNDKTQEVYAEASLQL